MAYSKENLSVKVALAAIFGALYAISLLIFPYIQFYIWQVRYADCLLPLSFILAFPSAVGLAIGCFIGNFFAPLPFNLGPVDWFGGAITNFLAAYIGYQVEKRNNYKGLKRAIRTQLSISVQTLFNIFIVGTYLALLLGWPLYIGWLGLLIGSLISMNFLGFLIYEALRKTGLYEAESTTANLKVAMNHITRNFAHQ
ncbi:MAG: QueT transporter family protein [Candidatus Helarchaeota archaeon]|nr:QueT transporter family protein [Candidatus Helarchaeota archaeon]